MRFTRLMCVLLVASLTGCSTLSGWLGRSRKANEPIELNEFKQDARIDVLWHQDVGDAGENVLQAAVSDDAVYAANADGNVFRFDRTTGKQLWRADSDFVISGGVGTGEGLVLVGGEKGDLAAFGYDGKLRWKVKLSSEVLSAPQVSNGIVVVRTGDSHIVGLNVKNGVRQWLYERTTPALIVRSHAGVTIAHGIVYAGFAGGRLVLINLSNGSVQWETAVSQPRGNTELERISDITSLPAVDAGQVCAIAFQGRMACYDIARGNPLWSRELSSDKGLTLARNNLYMTDSNGVVYALNKFSGSSLWKNEKLLIRRTTMPAVVGSYVAVGDFEGYLHLLSIEDGHIAARFASGGGKILTPPIELDGGLLLQTSEGDLYSLAIH